VKIKNDPLGSSSWAVLRRSRTFRES